MKKVFRYLGITVLVIVVLVGLLAAVIAIRGIPSYKAEKIELAVTATPERIAQGQKLATMLCRNCHLDANTGRFTGHRMDEIPQFGTIYSRNITQDKQHGIGNWTDGELAYLLRTGVKPDGTYLPPYMPKLPNLADEDLYSIIAFLRSEHPWVKADPTVVPPSSPSFLTKMITGLGLMKPFPYPVQPIALPDTNNKVAWGKYIALGQMDCFTCHSRDFSKNDYLNPEKSPGFFGGGNEMGTSSGKKIVSRNITMDEETGIGRWSEEDFVRAVKTGQLPHGQNALREPMAPYAMLTDGEVRAIWAYLQTVPKIQNKVERSQ
ncbi:MAG: c-type cytochrome [Chitinophagaceae bacterium]|nr:MAG: c-type cytochrome [Chitinophagaceae bacterium]